MSDKVLDRLLKHASKQHVAKFKKWKAGKAAPKAEVTNDGADNSGPDNGSEAKG